MMNPNPEEKMLIAVDLDDTLIQTDAVNSASYQLALQEYGVMVSDDTFASSCSGKHYLAFLPELMGEKATAEEIEHVHERKKMLYSACIGKAHVNRALKALLEQLRATGSWCTALVTTGNQKNTMEVLSYFGCLELFDCIITSADVTRHKPDPQGYRMAMERLGVPPERTIIFEDSATGLQAAKASGASVFRVEPF